MRDGDGLRINGTTSLRDIAGTPETAHACLRFLPGAAFVDIHLYGVNWEESAPVEQVYREAAEA